MRDSHAAECRPAPSSKRFEGTVDRRHGLLEQPVSRSGLSWLFLALEFGQITDERAAMLLLVAEQCDG